MRRVLVAVGTGIVLLIGWTHWPAPSVPETATIDRLRLKKAERTLTLFDDGVPVQSYPVALSIHPTGPKRFEGDGRVPEETYRVVFHHPGSIAYKALRLTYPNRGDRQTARQQGRSPGGRIEIHGLPPTMAWVGRAHRLFNYTLGCIAVTSDERSYGE